jgi:CHAD domain-containing protein
VIRQKLDAILEISISNSVALKSITRRLDTMAGKVTDIDAILTTLETDLATLQTQNAETLQLLQSKQASNPTVDLSQEIARIAAVDAALNALSASQASADAPAPTPTPSTPVAAAPVAPAAPVVPVPVVPSAQ